MTRLNNGTVGAVWLVLALSGAGCGGGQGTAGSVSATGHSLTAGDAVFTYFGQPKPQLTSSSGTISVIGQAGATFSTVTLEPSPSLDDTYFVFGRNVVGASELYRLPYAGAGAQLLFQTGNGAQNVGVSAYGTVAFNEGNSGFPFTVRNDGTGVKPLTLTGVSGAYGARYSVDGTNRIAFTDGSTGIYVAPGAGGAATLVQNNAVPGTGAGWSPSGTQLIYSQAVGVGNEDLFVTSTSGGATTDVTPSVLRNSGFFYGASWSPDGVTIAAAYLPDNGSIDEIVKFPVNQPNAYQIITPTGDSDTDVSFSPDGSKLVFYRDSANGATPGIYECDAAGGNQTLVLADPSNNPNSILGGLAWSPFLPKETVVAATGSTFYHQAASGFLLTQNGDQFGSMVAFTAKTPADAAIQAPTANSQYAPMLFTLTADSITEIGYSNNYFSPGTILSLASTPSVVVSVDAITGQVDLVAPSATAKAAITKNADGTVTYNAAFKAIYDGTGKNLAPSGAKQLIVNPKSGKLVSFK